MFGILSLFWYCYDDWLAGATGHLAIGEVPFLLWLIVWLCSGVIDNLIYIALTGKRPD